MQMKRKILALSSIITVPIGGLYGVAEYKSRKPTTIRPHLVFDLDNTLIHSKPKVDLADINMSIFKKFNFDEGEYFVWHRPFAKSVVIFLSKFCNLHLFTSADQSYADPVIDNMFPVGTFQKRLYYESCEHEGKNVEKLNVENPLLIDDKKYNWYNENQAFYHIPPFKLYNTYDFEMIKLLCHVLVKNPVHP